MSVTLSSILNFYNPDVMSITTTNSGYNCTLSNNAVWPYDFYGSNYTGSISSLYMLPIVLNNNDVFDGNFHIITVERTHTVSGTTTTTIYNGHYQGFLNPNGTGIDASIFPQIKNLGVDLSKNTITIGDSVGETLGGNGGGGIVFSYKIDNKYSTNFSINNCYTNGGILYNWSGGICGQVMGFGGSCSITKCYSTSIMDPGTINAGGICGQNAGTSGVCNISSCYYKEDIPGIAGGGGICGQNAGENGTCIITNCYYSGSNLGGNSGGICGQFSGIGGSCSISNCYVSGNITSTLGGAICGSFSTCSITNCYYIGTSTTSNFIGSSSSVTVNNSYGTCNYSSETPVISGYTTSIISAMINSGIFSASTLNNGPSSDPWQNCQVNSNLTDTITGIPYSNIPILTSFYTTRINNLYGYRKYIDSPTFSIPYIDKLQYVGNGQSPIINNTDNTITDNTNMTVPPYTYKLRSDATWPNDFLINGYTPAISDSILLKGSNGNIWTFDGGNYQITINQTDYSFPDVYLGLFTGDINRTGTEDLTTPAIIKNLTIASITIDRESFNQNDYGGGGIYSYTNSSGSGCYVNINNCHTIASSSSPNKLLNLTYQCGGIIGNNAGLNGGCNITNCSSTGDSWTLNSNGQFNGQSKCGGIAGDSPGGWPYLSSTGTCTILNCYTSGIVGYNSGGIVGTNAGVSSGTCIIKNCYSAGDIKGYEAGGISGSGTATGGICNISNCYSSGNIIGFYSGGITGSKTASQYFYNSTKAGTCNISNCYSLGSINNYSGGIIGAYTLLNTSGTTLSSTCICNINNCYSTGAISAGSGGISGQGTDAVSELCGTLNITNCYSVGTITNNTPIYGGAIVGKDTANCNIGNCYYVGQTTSANPSYFIGSGTTVTISSPCSSTGQWGDPSSVYAPSNFTGGKPNFQTSGSASVSSWFNSTILNANSDGSYWIKSPGSLTNILYPILSAFHSEPWYNYDSYLNKPAFIDPCFAEGTNILTPSGYVKVENLKIGDKLLTYQNKIIEIKNIVNFMSSLNKNMLYKLEKNALEVNVPNEDLYMSEGHAFKYNNNWYHMYHNKWATKTEEKISIKYYHILINDWFSNTLVANGVEVESYYDSKYNNNIELTWLCDENSCKYKKIQSLEHKIYKNEKCNITTYSNINKSKKFNFKIDKNLNNLVITNKNGEPMYDINLPSNILQ
jgi:hypothetical protein